MVWGLAIMWAIIGIICMIPSPILGGIVLFSLCVWGLFAGPWWIIIISVLFLLGLAGIIAE